MSDTVQVVFRSGAMASLIRKLDRLAEMDAKTASPCSVVIQGETGAGKDLVARRIHEKSGRAGHPFVALNCSAVPAELFESELFGHERGAFTSACAQKRGLFEQAKGGTLFLDEVADLPITLQVKLLRALQNRVVRRVGGNKDIETDVRVIVACNRDLVASVAAGEFRGDLYYRLNVFSVSVPALRERPDDIMPLVDYFCAQNAQKYGVAQKRVSDAALAALTRYAWPGNVRELEHFIESAYIVSEGDEVGVDDLDGRFSVEPFAPTPPPEEAPAAPPEASVGASDAALRAWVDALPEGFPFAEFRKLLHDAKIRYFRRQIDLKGGVMSRAAKAVGVERSYLRRVLLPQDAAADPAE